MNKFLSNYVSAKVVKNVISDKTYNRLKKELSINIDPLEIKYYAEPYGYLLKKALYGNNIIYKAYNYLCYLSAPFIIPKDIEIKYKLFIRDKRYEMIHELWKYDFLFKKTKRYKYFKNRLERDKVIYNKGRYAIKSDEDIYNYFEDYKKLLISMSKEGYLKQKSVDEIFVWIDAEGRFIKQKHGRHRLAAAQVTNTQNIPVTVKNIHSSWLQYLKDENEISSQLSLDEQILKSIKIALNYNKLKNSN